MKVVYFSVTAFKVLTYKPSLFKYIFLQLKHVFMINIITCKSNFIIIM